MGWRAREGSGTWRYDKMMKERGEGRGKSEGDCEEGQRGAGRQAGRQRLEVAPTFRAEAAHGALQHVVHRRRHRPGPAHFLLGSGQNFERWDVSIRKDTNKTSQDSGGRMQSDCRDYDWEKRGYQEDL